MNQKIYSSEKKSLTWWQWILMYPTLIIAILGSVPTAINIFESIKLDVPLDEVQIAKEQIKLWNRNFECARTSPTHWSNVDENGVKIGVIVCPSKDVLVSVNGNIQASYRWIGYHTFDPIQQSTNFLISAAVAAEINNPPQVVKNDNSHTVLCQKKLPDHKILRRVKAADGRCFDQTIDTATGKVIKEALVKCDSDCNGS
ncbi:MAG: hypothetical protein WBA77_14405 [Microcoleaceae cyanobacterium]